MMYVGLLIDANTSICYLMVTTVSIISQKDWLGNEFKYEWIVLQLFSEDIVIREQKNHNIIIIFNNGQS